MRAYHSIVLIHTKELTWLKISNAIIIVLTSGACISPEAKQIIHDFKGCSFTKKTHVRPSAYLERRTRKRRQGANIMNKTSGRAFFLECS